MIPDADFGPAHLEWRPRAAQSDPALLSVAQAAERFKMSERAFRYWMDSEDFPLRRLRRGQRWAFSARQVDRYMDGELENGPW